MLLFDIMSDTNTTAKDPSTAGAKRDESGLMTLHVRWTEDSENDGYYHFSDQYDMPSVDLVNSILKDFAGDHHDISWDWLTYQDSMPKNMDFNSDLVFSWFGVNVFHPGHEPMQHDSLSLPMLLTINWGKSFLTDTSRIGRYVLRTYGPWKYVQQALRTILQEIKDDGNLVRWEWTGIDSGSDSDRDMSSTGDFHSDLVHAYFGLDLVVPKVIPKEPSAGPNVPPLDISKVLPNIETSCERMKSDHD